MKRVILVVLSLAVISLFGPELVAHSYTDNDMVFVEAETFTSPSPKIRIKWKPVTATNVLRYEVHRKLKTQGWLQKQLVATLSGTATQWEDTSVTIGSAFDYMVRRFRPYESDPEIEVDVNGFIHAGIEVPVVEDRGKVVLVVESEKAAEIATELRLFEEDLAGDGWTVLRHDYPRGLAPTHSGYGVQVVGLRELIVGLWNGGSANLKCVLLLGHLPVPYAGKDGPDGHGGLWLQNTNTGEWYYTGDHRGAWPSDLYFADMNESWTDTTVTQTVSDHPHNYNIPNDGKFDQEGAAHYELQLGRIDLYDMPSFFPLLSDSARETELLKQYLSKNYQFRHGIKQFGRRAFIEKNLPSAPLYASSSFMNLFGEENLETSPELDLMSEAATKTYLWAGAFGHGHFHGLHGGFAMTGPAYPYGNLRNLVTDPCKVAFMILYGSYFGDWDNTDNFLRAPLCNQDVLATTWIGEGNFGSPFAEFFGTALGDTLGEAHQRIVNLSSPDPGGQGHVSIAGDATLKTFVVLPPTAARAEWSYRRSDAILRWQASPEPAASGSSGVGLLGYNVYRGTSRLGPFTKLNTATVTGTSYTDNSPGAGEGYYMVRALKREQTPGGTFFNLSQGVFVPMVRLENPRFNGSSFAFDLRGDSSDTLHIEAASAVNASSWTSIGTVTLSGGEGTFQETLSTPPSYPYARFYRARLGGSKSANNVGFCQLVAPPGDSMVANQFYVGDNTPAEIFAFSTVAAGTTLSEHIAATGGYNYGQFIGGAWEGDPISFDPGEGAWFENTSSGNVLLRFYGEVPAGSLSVSRPAGLSMVSSMVPQGGVLDVDLGFPPANGDEIHRFNPATGGYITSSFIGGAWEGDEAPPTVRVGECFWINTPSPKTWLRAFSVND